MSVSVLPTNLFELMRVKLQAHENLASAVLCHIVHVLGRWSLLEDIAAVMGRGYR